MAAATGCQRLAPAAGSATTATIFLGPLHEKSALQLLRPSREFAAKQATVDARFRPLEVVEGSVVAGDVFWEHFVADEYTTTDTVVIGAGQAGIATSEHLSKLGVPHVVLERHRIAERWRSERWDSLVANGPAWHDRFPNLKYDDVAADAFASKEQIASYFEAYARMIGAPVRTGVEVTRVRRNEGRMGFNVQTSAGTYDALRVVVATGPFQLPSIPPILPRDLPQLQIHSSAYRNPGQLPPGGVLVIGAGSSGVQIADELHRSGRSVYLSVGAHDRPPRSYRGLDSSWWMGVLGQWDKEAMTPGREHVTIAVSGAHGGYTVDFRALANRGVVLVGQARGFRDGAVEFSDDLASNLAQGDESYLSILRAADAYATANGLALPEEPQAYEIAPDPECVRHPLTLLRLDEARISTILWATGFRSDYSWLQVDAIDAAGKPCHHRGTSTEPGLYFVGLPWQTRRGSAFIFGVWHDAKLIADRIAAQRAYLAYRDPSGVPAGRPLGGPRHSAQ